ncbi:MAG: potassium transporter Kup [Betaproteobacteria bacterium]|nr:MAG: potassium transporter Kup [Betaproteobacteria bacterium]
MPPTSGARSPTRVLALTALGVVFGDIGTSPLYAFKEAFAGSHSIALTEANVFATLSLIFWSVMLIVSLKYVTIVLNFDNRGEGGILALLAFAGRLLRRHKRMQWIAGLIAVLGASLFFGDAIITPAISVLSAVEGLSVAAPALEKGIIPVSICVLIALFAIQSRGTGAIGGFFGWIMLLWFATLGTLGALSIAQTPSVLSALDPRHALAFAAAQPQVAFIALGAVFLALTGGEALYADMGHFGRLPIRLAWFAIVLPALMLNYFGQGALVLRDATAVKNPFYLLAPPDLVWPLLILATAATVIASQATISGAFSVTQQASRLGYLPRVSVLYTSETERGQIYIPRVNWLLLILVLALVLEFKTSSAIAAAYGIAVATTMVLETSLVILVVFMLGRRYSSALIALLAVIGAVEFMFFASNATKFVAGGWFPVAVAVILFTLLTTWKLAVDTITASEEARRVPIEGFLPAMAEFQRVPGTAIFFSAEPDSVPTTLLHNLKHNKVLHERIVFLRVVTEEVPRIPDDERTEIDVLERGRCYKVTLRYGFREEPDIPHALKLLGQRGLSFELDETTFFLGKTSIARAERRSVFTWRRELFRWMQKNSPSAAEYFRLPPSRVIELGTQISV